MHTMRLEMVIISRRIELTQLFCSESEKKRLVMLKA